MEFIAPLPFEEALQKLRWIMTYAMVANVFMAAMEVFTVFYSGIPEHVAHYSQWTWISLVMSCVALGLALFRSRAAPLAVFLSLGADKGVVLIPAGLIPSTTGAVVPYFPTVRELGIVVAIWCVGALVVTFLFRIEISVHAARRA